MPIGASLERRAEARLGLLQRGLGGHPLGDVAHRGVRLERRAPCRVAQHAQRGSPTHTHVAVGAAQPQRHGRAGPRRAAISARRGGPLRQVVGMRQVARAAADQRRRARRRAARGRRARRRRAGRPRRAPRACPSTSPRAGASAPRRRSGRPRPAARGGLPSRLARPTTSVISSAIIATANVRAGRPARAARRSAGPRRPPTSSAGEARARRRSPASRRRAARDAAGSRSRPSRACRPDADDSRRSRRATAGSCCSGAGGAGARRRRARLHDASLAAASRRFAGSTPARAGRACEPDGGHGGVVHRAGPGRPPRRRAASRSSIGDAARALEVVGAAPAARGAGSRARRTSVSSTIRLPSAVERAVLRVARDASTATARSSRRALGVVERASEPLAEHRGLGAALGVGAALAPPASVAPVVDGRGRDDRARRRSA